MPVGPAQAIQLLEVYDGLVSGATDLVGAASAIAPAAVRDVICKTGGFLGLLAGPLAPYQGPVGPYGVPYTLGGILEAACPLPPPPPTPLPPMLPPPFTGGQCDCIQYRVQVRSQAASGPATDSFYFRKGPISPPVVGQQIPENPNRLSWGFYYGAASCGGRFFETNVSAPLDRPGDVLSYSVVGVTRPDGLADSCGNPPSPGPTPDPPIPQPPDSPQIPTVGPDGQPGTPIVFKPRVGPIYFGPDGSINVPVTINVNGPSLNIPISIPVAVSLPDFKPTFVNPGPNPSPPGGTPKPPSLRCCEPPPPVESPVEPPPPSDDPPDPPLGTKIIGVLIVSTAQAGKTRSTTYYAAKPEIHVPRLATVQFQVRADKRLGWSLPIEVKSKNQLIEAPKEGRVVNTSVVWEQGWSGTSRQLYGAA